MAQSNEVRALRKRMVRRGYMHVRIYSSPGGGCWVCAEEPLGGMAVQAMLGADEITQALRRK